MLTLVSAWLSDLRVATNQCTHGGDLPIYYVECFSALSTFVDIVLFKMNHYDYYFAVTARKVWSKEETALLAAEFKHYIELPAPSKNLPREFFTLTLNTPYQFQPAHTYTHFCMSEVSLSNAPQS